MYVYAYLANKADPDFNKTSVIYSNKIDSILSLSLCIFAFLSKKCSQQLLLEVCLKRKCWDF